MPGASVDDGGEPGTADQALPVAAVFPWTVLRGTVCGLDQQAVIGKLLVGKATQETLGELDRTLETLIGETPPPLPPARDTIAGLAARVLQWMTAVQNYANIPVSSRQYLGQPDRRPDGYWAVDIAAPCFSRSASSEALNWAIDAIGDVVTGRGNLPSLRSGLASLRARLQPHALTGLNMIHFARAALALDIPFYRISARIFSFGTGCRARLLDSSFTDRTPRIASTMAHNKVITATVLRRAGLPAPTHVAVDTADDAVKAADRIGYPVVVKPMDQEQGRGVTAGIADDADVRSAFAEARRVSSSIIVEKHVEGRDYRLTVFNRRVVKIENRVAGGVAGDGVSTVRQLVEAAQQTPRMQKIFRDTGKLILQLDAEALGMIADAGLAPDSVPEDGSYLALRRKNNISTGGRQIGIPPEDVHPDNIELAVRAAHALRLDFAGIDLIIPDIARSWLEIGGVICEVNSQPQVGALTTPAIYRDILAEMMGGEARIPAHLVIGRLPAAEALRRAAALGCNGLAAPEGVWLNGRKLAAIADSAFGAADILLNDIDSEAVLFILPPEEVLKFGLPTDRFRTIEVAPAPDLEPGDLDKIRHWARPHAETFSEV
ncbi:MAG: acetate--CoA ligase family protein [Sphingomonadales bacterium]